MDAATHELAKAVGARHEAEKKRAGADAAVEQADASARAARDEEREALEKGELRAGDLHRAQTWEVGVAAERKRLAESAAAAAQGEEKARRAEAGAQGALASREADAKVVDEDKARFVAREAQRTLAKEEEASAEAHEAKRWRRER